MRIHTASVGRGISAFPVHGALTDHHRLIWQFGVVPLMYYLYGENVIIDVGEEPHMGSVALSLFCSKNHRLVDREMYAITKTFRFGLEIPMAVTGAVKLASVLGTESNSRRSQVSEVCPTWGDEANAGLASVHHWVDQFPFSLRGNVVAIKWKTPCGSFGQASKKGALRTITAFATESNLVLRQLSVEKKIQRNP